MNFVTATPSLICAMRSFSTSTGFFRCLGKKCKIFFIQNPGVCWNIANQTTVDFLFAEKNFFVLFKCFHILIDTVIGKKGHTIFFQRFQYVCLKGFLICKSLISVFVITR